MNIFKERKVTNLVILGEGITKIFWDDGQTKVHNYTVWSVHSDEGATSGMLHLFQNGAGAGFGYFGYWVSEENPLVLNSIPLTKIQDVSDELLNTL